MEKQEEKGKAEDLKRRKHINWDVVINDMRSSRKCHIFKEILGRWINRYKNDRTKEVIVQSIHEEMVKAGIRFLVREQDGVFVLAKIKEDVLDCIERALHHMLKAKKGSQSANNDNNNSDNKRPAPFAVPDPSSVSGMPSANRLVEVLRPEQGRVGLAFPQDTVPNVNVARWTADVPAQPQFHRTVASSSTPPIMGPPLGPWKKRARPPTPEAGNEKIHRMSVYYPHHSSRGRVEDMESIVRRLQAEKAVLEIRTERLEGRVQRLETIVMALGQTNEPRRASIT